VDAGAVGRGRRDAGLEGHHAPLPSPAAVRQSALHQLLAGRLCDPRHRRHGETQARLRPRLEPAVPVPDPQRVPVPFEINGRKILVVADEDVFHLFPGPPAFLWIVDVTMEDRPVPISTFQIEALDGTPQPKATACHQPVEKITGSEVPAAWFAHGMRIIDIGRPQAPREVRAFRTRSGTRRRPAGEQRRVRGRARADLPARPRARLPHPGAGLSPSCPGRAKRQPGPTIAAVASPLALDPGSPSP